MQKDRNMEVLFHGFDQHKINNAPLRLNSTLHASSATNPNRLSIVLVGDGETALGNFRSPSKNK
jgi:hypothetical protein